MFHANFIGGNEHGWNGRSFTANCCKMLPTSCIQAGRKTAFAVLVVGRGGDGSDGAHHGPLPDDGPREKHVISLTSPSRPGITCDFASSGWMEKKGAGDLKTCRQSSLVRPCPTRCSCTSIVCRQRPLHQPGEARYDDGDIRTTIWPLGNILSLSSLHFPGKLGYHVLCREVTFAST